MSTIIKAGQIPAPLGRARRIELTDHLNEAQSRLDEARRQAGALVDTARETAGAIHADVARAAYREGFRSGHAAGQQAGRQEAFDAAAAQFRRDHHDLIEAIGCAVAGIEALKEELLIQAKGDVLDLAVAIAEKVTKRLGALDRDAARANAQAAIELLGPQTDLTLRIHPRDAATMRQFASELADRLQAVQHVHLVEDESQSPGGCVVESGDRHSDARLSVDAGIDTQIEQIVLLLLGESDPMAATRP